MSVFLAKSEHDLKSEQHSSRQKTKVNTKFHVMDIVLKSEQMFEKWTQQHWAENKSEHLI